VFFHNRRFIQFRHGGQPFDGVGPAGSDEARLQSRLRRAIASAVTSATVPAAENSVTAIVDRHGRRATAIGESRRQGYTTVCEMSAMPGFVERAPW
jgi:hypothetical protein